MLDNAFKILAAGVALFMPILSPPAVLGEVKTDTRIELHDGQLRVQIIVNPGHLNPLFGPRFDNTAMVNGVWVDQQPFLKDGSGLVDEFGITGVGTLNFDEAKPGDSFIKIGVGELTRPDDKPYFFDTPYAVKRTWPVRVEEAGNQVAVRQGSEIVDGYGYSYEKRYRIDANTLTLHIHYRLHNSGSKRFEVEQYNHNFLCFSNRPIGASYSFSPGFDLKVAENKFGRAAAIEDGGLKFVGMLHKPGSITTTQPVRAADSAITVRENETGQWARIKSSADLNRFVLYAQPDAICPEQFCRFVIAPGETAVWEREYQFGIDTRSEASATPSSRIARNTASKSQG